MRNPPSAVLEASDIANQECIVDGIFLDVKFHDASRLTHL